MRFANELASNNGGRGSLCDIHLVIYIHKLPFKKCNLIGLCFLGYPYEVRFAPLGLKFDTP
jgi:hypothetical protein